MKKIFIATLSIFIILSGCSKQSEKTIEIEVPIEKGEYNEYITYSKETDKEIILIEDLFFQKYEMKKDSDISFVELGGVRNIGIYDIYDNNLNKKNTSFNFGSFEIIREATSEIYPLDIFIKDENELLSLYTAIHQEIITFDDIKSIFKDSIKIVDEDYKIVKYNYGQSDRLLEIYETLKNEESLTMIEYIKSSDNTIDILYPSANFDDVLMLEERAKEYDTEIIFFEYSTPEQKTSIFKAIEERKINALSNWIIENDSQLTYITLIDDKEVEKQMEPFIINNIKYDPMVEFSNEKMTVDKSEIIEKDNLIIFVFDSSPLQFSDIIKLIV